MENLEGPAEEQINQEQEKNLEVVRDEMKKENDNPVKQASKKERQPGAAEDLSSIHDTHAVGTSGGDQREPDREAPSNDDDPAQPGKPQKPIPVEEPGEGSAPDVIYDEPGSEPELDVENPEKN